MSSASMPCAESGERGTLSVTNYLFPFIYHSLTVTPARGGGPTRLG